MCQSQPTDCLRWRNPVLSALKNSRRTWNTTKKTTEEWVKNTKKLMEAGGIRGYYPRIS